VTRHDLLACATLPCCICGALGRALDADRADRIDQYRFPQRTLAQRAQTLRVRDRVFVLALAVDAGAGLLDVAAIPVILRLEQRTGTHLRLREPNLSRAVTVLARLVGDDPWTHSALLDKHATGRDAPSTTASGARGAEAPTDEPAGRAVLLVPPRQTRGT